MRIHSLSIPWGSFPCKNIGQRVSAGLNLLEKDADFILNLDFSTESTFLFPTRNLTLRYSPKRNECMGSQEELHMKNHSNINKQPQTGHNSNVQKTRTGKSTVRYPDKRRVFDNMLKITSLHERSQAKKRNPWDILVFPQGAGQGLFLWQWWPRTSATCSLRSQAYPPALPAVNYSRRGKETSSKSKKRKAGQ